MKVLVKTGNLVKTPTDLLVVNLFEGVRSPGGATGAVDKALSGLLSDTIRDEQFKGKESQVLMLHTHGKVPAKRVLLVGLGKQQAFALETVRRAAGTSVRKAKEVAAQKVTSVLHGAGVGGLDPRPAAEAMTEGALLADYRFLRHKGEENQKETERAIEEFIIVERDPAKAKKADAGIEEGTTDAEATIYARDLVNEPPSHLTPTVLATEGRKLKGQSITIEVFGRDECAKLGMGAFLGVAKGSEEEPRFIHLSYRPPRPFDKTQGALSRAEVRKLGGKPKKIVLVGKGITFDTGGVQLKERKGMITMKMDMSGAAAVLGLFSALPKLRLPIEVHGIIAATENMPSGGAYKPGDVLRSMNGKTIEVIDTDAEGRLTLADALAFATTLKPDAIIDFATLTGSVVAGLGDQVAGLLGNNQPLLEAVKKAAASAGEMVWPLPLVKEYGETIKSKVADLKNVGGREGDVIKATLFLAEFVGKIPWAHLDIAGPAYAEKDFNVYTPEGGTGFGVRTMLHYLRSLAN